MDYAYIGVFTGGSAGRVLDTDITARQSIVLNGAIIWYDVSGSDSGGSFSLTAPVIRLENYAYLSFSTSGEGDAGNIIFNASRSLDILSSTVITTTGSSGNSGQIQITTSALRLDGEGNGSSISPVTLSTRLATTSDVTIQADTMVLDNWAQINTENYSPQEGGNITIQAVSLSMTRTAFISARTLGEDRKVIINITADSILLDRADSQGADFGILAGTDGERTTGRGGDVFIKAGMIQLLNGALISSSSDRDSVSNTGDVRIEADSIILSGSESGGFRTPSSIQSLCTGTGDPGSVIINATREVVVENSAAISVSSPGGGGGNVEITTPNITIENAQVTAQEMVATSC